MPIPIPGLPNHYFPRALVVLQVFLEDNVPASAGLPAPVPVILSPSNLVVERNDARHADECTIVLDYKDFLLDARIVKAIQVSAHMEDLQQAEQPMLPTPLNLRFIGLVDEPKTDLSEASETVTFRCRDFTAQWLDRKWGQTPIPATITLQAAVELMRAAIVPATLPAIFDPTAATAAATPLNIVLGGKKVYAAKRDADAWEVLSDLCALFGLVPVYDRDLLMIRPAAPTAPGPAPTFIYGQLVERLSFQRDLRNRRAKPVKVVQWDPQKGLPLEVYWPAPAPAGKVQPTATGVATPTVTLEYQQHNVTGSLSLAELTLVARRLYDESKAGDLEGTLETKEMWDLIVPGLSLLGLANGSTIAIAFDPLTEGGTLSFAPAGATKYLLDILRPNALVADVASMVTAAWYTAQTTAVLFYVRAARHEWDRDSGYRLKLDFVQFILG